MKEILFPHQIEAAITGNPFLSLLDDAEWEECIQQSSLFIITKGEALHRAGEPAECVWAVADGQAKIVKQSHSGRCLLIEIIMPGEICGGICYSGNIHFVFSAFAMEETKALRFPLHVLQKSAETWHDRGISDSGHKISQSERHSGDTAEQDTDHFAGEPEGFRAQIADVSMIAIIERGDSRGHAGNSLR